MKFSQIVVLTIVTTSPMALADDLEPVSLGSLTNVPAATTVDPIQLTITGLPSHISKHSKTAKHTKSKDGSHSHHPTGTGEHHHPHPTGTHHGKHNETDHYRAESGFKTHTREGFHCIEIPWETETAKGPKETGLKPEPIRDHPRRWTEDESENNELASVSQVSGQPRPTGGRRMCFPGILPPIRHHSGEPTLPGGVRPTETTPRPTGTKKVIGPLKPTLSGGAPIPSETKVIGPIVLPSTTGIARSTVMVEPIESPRPIPTN